jgi:hypothetical protein
MPKPSIAISIAAFLGLAAAAYAGDRFSEARPFVFDPGKTHLAQSGWLSGIGCPTNARIFNGSSTSPYTDPACPTGDPRDRVNEGLLLVKTGPTRNVASGGVVLNDVKNTAVKELGYDIRKPGVAADTRGSHCGAGAPRFNVVTKDGRTFFIGCNSPSAPVQQAGNGWLRLRWGGAVPLLGFNAKTGTLTNISGAQVKQIAIVFDEGQDAGPDTFGLAVLDNIDVNGRLIGQGPGPGKSEGGDNGGEGDNGD